MIGLEYWRILQKSNNTCLAIQLYTGKTKLNNFNLYELEDSIINNKIQLVDEYREKSKEINLLEGKDIESYNRSVEFIQYIFDNCNCSWDWLQDCHDRALIVDKLACKFGMGKVSVRRYIRRYLQSGMKIESMISDYSNCGAKGTTRKFINDKAVRQGGERLARNEEMVQIFEKMSKKYIRSKARISFVKLYEDMIADYYSDKKLINGSYVTVPYNANNRPSYRQFLYWMHTNIDETTLLVARVGKREVANNYRPLFSDTIAHLTVKAIGTSYEMDEMETDFYLVSRSNRNKVIGRAILYLIIDVYSRCIVGCGVGLDNNSWSGAEIALLNMAEDKVEFCSKYGITITYEEWPIKGVLPRSITMDNGAEYLSKKFPELVSQHGIGMSYLPPRMGSFKPNVEQKFHQMNCHLKERLPGQIIKDEYGQSHIAGARLDIAEFTQCVIRFVLNYNNTPMDNYPDTRDMYKTQIELTPINIWNYSLARNNELIKINDLNAYKYSLLSQGMASLTRSGIEFEKMFYICSDITWLEDEARRLACGRGEKKKIPIRYDKRNLNYIYYDKKGNIHVAWLNSPNSDSEGRTSQLGIGYRTSNDKYANLTSYEVDEINNTKQRQKRNNKEKKLKNNINTSRQIKNIVKSACKKHYGSNEKNAIKANRDKEKQKLHSEQFIEIIAFNEMIEDNKGIESKDIKQECMDPSRSIDKMSRLDKLKWVNKQKFIDNHEEK